MSRQCFVIYNPTSGSFSPKKIERIRTGLKQSDLEPVLLQTTNPLDATLFASRICADNPDPLIVVAGGDGTINGVLNGLTAGVATLGVIPMGTSNVLARELRIRSLGDALKRVKRGESRPAPVGELYCGGGKRRFVLMAGVGFDGAVVQGVRLDEKKRYGKLAYVLSALRLFSDWDSATMQVKGDGQNLSCHSVIVCNASKYGGNFILSRDGDLFTPGFQVVCVKGGRFAYLKLLLLLALGRVGSSNSVTIFPASDIEVSGRKAVQLDGDYFGSAPLRLKSIPDFVRVIV